MPNYWYDHQPPTHLQLNCSTLRAPKHPIHKGPLSQISISKYHCHDQSATVSLSHDIIQCSRIWHTTFLSINNWAWLTYMYIRSLFLSFPLMRPAKYVSWSRHLHFVQNIFPSPHNAHSHLVQRSRTVRLHHSSCMPTQTLPRSWGPGPPCRQSDGVHTRSPSPQTEPCTPWQNARCRCMLITVLHADLSHLKYSKISFIRTAWDQRVSITKKMPVTEKYVYCV